MRYLLILTVWLYCMPAFGQKLSGIVTDRATGQRISGAWVIYGGLNTVSDMFGSFSLVPVKTSDTLKVKMQGYKVYKLWVRAIDGNNLIIPLEPGAIELQEVHITGKRNRIKDSLDNRRQFAHEFNSKPPKLKDIIEPSVSAGPIPVAGVSIHLSELITAITYKHSRAYKLKQVLVNDEQARYINSRFSESRVAGLTNLTADSLYDFINRYRPAIIQVKKMTDYDIIAYIKKHLEEYKQSANHKSVVEAF